MHEQDKSVSGVDLTIPVQRIIQVGAQNLSVEVLAYKYRLIDDYYGEVPKGWERISFVSEYIIIEDSKLWIKKGYAWDGPSGPTIDTIDTILASLVHDALYQVIESLRTQWRYAGRLTDRLRKAADRQFRHILRKEARRISEHWPWYQRIPFRLAMRLRRRAWHVGVRIGGGSHV